MLSLSAALRRFHPGGLLARATDGSRGGYPVAVLVNGTWQETTELVGKLNRVFCSLRIGRLPWPVYAADARRSGKHFRAACGGPMTQLVKRLKVRLVWYRWRSAG